MNKILIAGKEKNMRKLMLGCVCLITVFAVMLDEARAQLFVPSIELEKVIGNVYVGRQAVPLEGLFPVPGPGFYLVMNLYVIASEDRSEVVLVDAPGLPDLWLPFMSALEAELPGATIKGVLLTHDHIDHCWSAGYFINYGIPVYVSSAELIAPQGGYDCPLATPPITPIDPGFSIILNDGAVITAIDLAGHTPGHMGYAYYSDGDGDDDGGKINWFFAGDAVLAPPLDYGANDDPFNITYFVRLRILVEDTYSFQIWEENIVGLKGLLTKHAKLFPGHGAVREGYFWQDPIGYIDHTVGVLQPFLP